MICYEMLNRSDQSGNGYYLLVL